MFTHWLTYRAVAASLDSRCAGAVITALWTQEKDELTVQLAREGEEFALQISCAPHAAVCFLRAPVARARRNTLDVLPAAAGRGIALVRIAEDERAIGFMLDDGTLLVALLRGADANVVLADTTGRVIDAFKTTGSDTPIPSAWTLSAPAITEADIAAALAAQPDTPPLRALKTLHPWISGVFAKELAHRAGRSDSQTVRRSDRSDLSDLSDRSDRSDSPTVRASDGPTVRASDSPTVRQSERPMLRESDLTIASLLAAYDALIDECASPPWHVYFDGDAAVAFAPCVLTHAKFTRDETIDDINDALWLFVRKRGRGERLESLRARVLRAAQREKMRLDRLLARIDAPEILRKRADVYEKSGNLLMINATRMPEQPGRMTVQDLFTDPHLVVTITLDERASVIENAERYFDRAHNARAAMSHAEERIESARKRLERVDTFISEVEGAADARTLTQYFQTQTDLMTSFGLTPKGENNDRPFPFRSFTVTGGFEVWAGKSSANNDELTVRWAKPNDLWFHARGVGGSHVVLRVASAAGEPTKEAIREAAAIAAYYSKHRNAKSVPVAYTEKKYVRKPRGVPAGTVYLEREKVIMVAPALPPNAAKDEDE